MGEKSLEKSKDYDIHKSVTQLEAIYSSLLEMKEAYYEGIYYRKNEFHPDRITLVFSHGVSGSSSAWWPYEKIFKNKYNVLFMTFAGTGFLKNIQNTQIMKSKISPRTCTNFWRTCIYPNLF